MDSAFFNLSAPLEFRAFAPELPVRVYQRHLPHWRQDGATYAVTFRLADSIPKERLQQLNRWRDIWQRQHRVRPADRDSSILAREITKQIEAWMDAGFGACVLRVPQVAALMSRSILHFQNERLFTSCFVVMPNHVHTVMKPFDGFELEDTLRSIKQFVSARVNLLHGQSSPLWAEESYDRIVRDEEHLWRVVQYIGRNPAKAGLPQDEWVRWIAPSWEAAGWGFRDEG